MTAAANRFPLLFMAACMFIGVGIVCLLGTLILHPPSHIFKGLLFISFAFMIFGLGEVLNHPKERLIKATQVSTTQSVEFQRRRNVCSLGNLCDICALLLFFMGVSALFFPV